MQTGVGNEANSQSRAQLRYHFNVGSVDSFERKLDEAQEDLGWDPANFIPVTYCSEFSFVSEFTKLLPTILIIAGYVWFTRRSMGGLGGPGGPGGRGLFNVGKAQVSFIWLKGVSFNLQWDFAFFSAAAVLSWSSHSQLLSAHLKSNGGNKQMYVRAL